MKYMLMMHHRHCRDQNGAEVSPIGHWPPADIQAHNDFMHHLNRR